jgi:tRNA(Ile)-lysidine synthase
VPRRPPAVARVLERVTKTVREHDMFSPGDLVLVSVSGGPDSVCLLYSLWHLRRLFKIKLAVFHFDHRLREDSGRDAAYVRTVAERLKVSFHLRAAEEGPPKGVSVEAWGSVERGNAANSVRREIGSLVIAEGHTLDDRAETVLLNLVRGTGLEGLVGITPVAGERPYLRRVEPLIGLERADVEAFCRALHLRPRQDPTNEDRRLLRASIRHEVLPMLERATGRGVKGAIVRTSENLRSDRDELAFQAVRAYERIVKGERGRDVRFQVSELRHLPRPVASRVIRFAVYNAMSGEWAAPWSKDAIDAVLDLAAGRPGRRRDLPNGMKAWRDKQYVHIARPSPEAGGNTTREGAP